MSATLAEIRRLLAAGYDLEHVDSDAEGIAACFRRGSKRVLLRLGAVDAAELLYGPQRHK